MEITFSDNITLEIVWASMKEENIFIRQLKKHPLSFLYRLIKNLVFALFFFCLVLAFMYIVGNYQSFQFESQILILRAISFSSIALFIFSILILFETVIRFATKGEKVKSLIVILIMLFNIIFCIVCMSFSNIVYYLSEGF